jgi:exodeoxyribonuclease V alpha subunit
VTTVVLEGTVERVVYRGEGGFAVARLDVPGKRLPVTVAGPLPGVVEGEPVKVEGDWVDDPKYGRQVKVSSCERAAPAGAQAAERFLGSGLIKGVRARTAQKIVSTLGPDALRIIAEEPEKLAQVTGLGKKKRAEICQEVTRALRSRSEESFLRALGLGPGLTGRILEKYGAETRRVVEEDPYRMAREVDGVGFLTADRVARTAGVSRDDPARLRAGLAHALRESAEGHGDTCLPRDVLLDRAQKLLGASDRSLLEEALESAREHGLVALETIADAEHVYLPQLLSAERGTALVLASLASETRHAAGALSSLPALDAQGHAPTAEQGRAIEAALSSSLSVITGGPGVGKTTVVRALVATLEERRERVHLAAPTGRAAKRLEEATRRKAQTIHRLLEWSPRQAGFVRDSKNPLDRGTVVIDEASMVDVRLAHALVRALPPGAKLVLVGDQDQLPSVGPGNVLGDLIESGAAEVARLTEVFRQARASRIVENAHRVRRGEIPDVEPPRPGELEDFFFIEKEDAVAARDAILKVVCERIPKRFGLDPKRDVQVLSPMKKGACGADALNEALRATLNPGADHKEWAARDKVMQVKNDYDRDVFNGDVGEVVSVGARGEVVVRFDEREVSYDRSAARALQLAYCATVHKSQGGEFPAVVVPVLLEHYVLLARNLLYTAMTRGRRLVVLVGQKKALARAVSTSVGGAGRDAPRRSHLAERLRSALREALA